MGMENKGSTGGAWVAFSPVPLRWVGCGPLLVILHKRKFRKLIKK